MRAECEASSVRRLADWFFRNRRSGAITVAQWPNVALSLFVAATIVLRVSHPSGAWATVLKVVAAAAILVWGLDELIRGVNPFRRILGVAVLCAVIIGLVLR